MLWHQGESDNILDTSTADYVQRLESIIAQSRIDAGFDIPWGIAQASFVPSAVPPIHQGVIDAQALVAANDPLNFVGALTDDLTGPTWRAPDLIHFNGAGLQEHANRWHSAISGFFQPTGVPVPPEGSKMLDGEVANGQLSDVIASDDIDLMLDPSPTTNPQKQKIDLILVAETTMLTPTRFSFCLEGAMLGGPPGDVTQTIQVWNFAENSWDVLDSRIAAIVDKQVIADAAGDLTDYIHQKTGEVIVSVIWQSPDFSGQPFNWSIDLDQAIWLIGQ